MTQRNHRRLMRFLRWHHARMTEGQVKFVIAPITPRYREVLTLTRLGDDLRIDALIHAPQLVAIRSMEQP